MAGAAEFVVRLRDQVSGPAMKAAASVNRLKSAARGVTGNFRSAAGAFRQAGEAGQQSMFKTMLSSQLAASAIQAVGRAAMEAARALARMAAAGVAKLAQSVAFAENIKFALTKFLGSAGKADKAIAKLMKTANKLGVSFQDAASNFRAFVSAGFTETEAMGLVKFKADILAIGDGTEATGQRVTEAFKQIEKAMATGRIEADSFNSILSNLPVTKMQVLSKLAKKMGKDVEELAKMDVTKLPVKELLESFQEATLAVTGFGKAGEAAIAKQMSTMSGMYKFIKNNLTNAFDMIASKLAPKLAKSLLPIMKKFGEFLASDDFADFASNVAENLANALGKAAQFMMDFVAAAKDADVSAKLMTFVAMADRASSAITRLLQALNLLPGSGEEAAGGLGTLINALTAVGDAVGFALDMVAIALEIVDMFWQTVVYGLRQAWAAIVEWFSSLGGEAAAGAQSMGQSVGSSVAEGIAAGIMGAASAVVDAITGVVGSAIAKAKALLGISSPSKVFFGFGENTAIGMAKGLQDGTPTVRAAMHGMVTPSGVGGGGTTVNHISTSANVSIPAAADPQATAEAVRQMVVSQLGDTLEQLTVQVGAA